MAWQEDMVPLLRGLINDLDSSTYSDSTLEQYIVYAAHFNINEISFDTTYTIDMSQMSITPNPTSPQDLSFINLTVLKAAIFVLRGEVKEATAQSVRVVDGPSSMDFTGVYKAKIALLKMMEEDFGNAKLSAALGDLSVGFAILSPYTQEGIRSDGFRV